MSGEAFLLEPEQLDSPALADPWRQLAEARSNPFVTPEWMRAWLGSHPAEEPFAIGWRQGDELRGVLPLVRVRVGPVALLRFAGARRADWVSPACAPEDEAAMAAACSELLGRERGWRALRFDRLDEDSAWPAALRDLPGGALSVAPPRRRDVLPYIRFGEDGFEGYLAARSRNFRSQMGRRRRKLEKEHGLSFRITTEAAELGPDLDTFFRLHDARWAVKGGSSSADEATREHQRRFAAAALERGWLRLWTAESDGKAAASWYGWRIGERYCYALAGLDPAYEDLALGTVLLGHTIEQAAAEGVAIYDMMWGDEGYKKRFETDRRYATTWLFGRRRRPSAAAVTLAVRSAHLAEAMPPGVRRPLARLARAGRSS